MTDFPLALFREREQIPCIVQPAWFAETKTCKSNLETRDYPPQGWLNSCLPCNACGANPRGSYPCRAKACQGDFPAKPFPARPRALCLLNPLAGSVAPVGHRHIPEICDLNNLTDSGHGLSASGGEQVAPGTFTTSAGDIIPVAHVRTRGKALRTLQTSAKGVELTRKKHSGQTPADEVGRVGLRKRVHRPVFGNVCGVGIGSAVAPTLGTAGRTDSIRQKAAPTIIKVDVPPSGLLLLRQAAQSRIRQLSSEANSESTFFPFLKMYGLESVRNRNNQ